MRDVCSFTHEKLKKLIDFITVMPQADADHTTGHKFPFLAGEIFNCELSSILEKFFEAPEHKSPIAQSADTDEDQEVPVVEAEKQNDGEETAQQDADQFQVKIETKEKNDEESKETQASSQAESETTTSPKVDEEQDTSKYQLLNRLFQFVKGPAPVNPVLAGYFSKLLILLINRKQNQIV